MPTYLMRKLQEYARHDGFLNSKKTKMAKTYSIMG